MTQSLIQRSFAGGELSESVGARADQVKYQTGLRACRNFVVRKEGGAEMRTGTKMIKEVKNSAARTYFGKFVYNDDQTYVIEAGNGYFRFFREAAQIVVSGVTAWSNATDYVLGDLASRLGVNYYCILEHTNDQPPNVTYWYPLTGAVYEIPTPYATADLPTLKSFQQGDVVTLTHPSYDTYELRRSGHTAWTLVALLTAPSIAAPASVTNDDAGSGGDLYVVTTIKSDSYEESLASASTESTAVAAAGHHVEISWVQESGAQEYNVYKWLNGVYGFIGVAGDSASPAFVDVGIDPDTEITPPQARTPFSGANNHPSCGTIYQQRRVFGNTNTKVEGVWGSRNGMFSNYSISSPLQEDDAITFTVAGRRVQAIKHLVELDKLLIFTTNGVIKALGNSDGALLATQPPNLEPILGSNGANDMPPIVIGNSVLYVQARSGVVRDLKPDVVQGYAPRDLTVFSTHLFKGYTLSRWDYAEIPNSVAYACRSDGTLLGLTYLREHEIWGWHRHDTDGEIEDVVSVPEGEVDALYWMVKRTIDGATKRYIERQADPFIEATDDITVDAFYVDCGATYDGRNTSGTTMRLTTATDWTYEDEITVEASTGFFVSGDVGNSVVIWFIDDDDVRHEATIIVSEYTNTTHVKGFPIDTVDELLREVTLATWGKGVDGVSGLGHLEGKDVAVFADGHVIASPNNDDYTVVTVESGAISLDRPYMVIHVGLPYIAEIETLDMDVNGEQIRDRLKNITSISLLVESSRGIFAGPDADNLLEYPPVMDENTTVTLKTGLIEIGITSTWEETGRFLVRQVDPVPVTILAAIPNGEIGG